MTSTGPAVSAIVLNYINWEQTVLCGEDLLVQCGVKLDVVIVDNASPNDSLTRLKERFEGEPRVDLLASQHNGGYAQGNNHGVRWRLGHGPVDYFLVVNNDVRLPDRHAVHELVAFAAAHPDAGMVGPRVLTRAGFPQGPYRRPHPIGCCLRYWLPIIPLGYRLWRRLWREEKSRPCFALVGACLLTPAAAFARAGMFDEATFLGAEEYILADRMRRQGLRSYYVPAAAVVHAHDDSAIRKTGGEVRYLPGGVESMNYYFRQYQHAPEWRIRLFERSANFYGRIFLPLRQRLPL